MKGAGFHFFVLVWVGLSVVAGTALVAAAPVEMVRVEPEMLRFRNVGAETWRTAEALRVATGSNTYLTSAAVAPWDARRILVSTTFHGVFESRDGGESWRRLDRTRLAPLYKGNGFYEDISRVAYDETDPEMIWAERAQTGEILAVDKYRGVTVSFSADRGERALSHAVIAPDHPFSPVDEDRRRRMDAAADHVSFFLAPWHVGADSLPGHLEFARQHDFTAVVIDFKDDLGRVVYDTALETPHRVGAVRPFFDARNLIDTIHDNDLYLIARIVVFKDERLYRYQDNRFAIWDARLDEPWGIFRDGGQVEFWVDPFSEFVWDYNISIARELQELGVDEIQFDYIRTPAEGRRQDILYRFQADSPALSEAAVKRASAEADSVVAEFRDPRVQALTTFARRARAEIDIPISIDVFGFNGWYRMSYLGQDIAALAQYVDVISPMLYPSHFPRAFMGDLPYMEWAEYIYREGTARGRRITQDTVLIRPYIQAFLIGGELEFEQAAYTEYLKRQIRGSLDGGASGFTLWNFSGRYYMASRGLWFDDP